MPSMGFITQGWNKESWLPNRHVNRLIICWSVLQQQSVAFVLRQPSDAINTALSRASTLPFTRLGKIDFISLHDVCHSHQHIMIEILKLSWSCRCSVGLQQSELSQQAQDWEPQKEEVWLSIPVSCPEQTGNASYIDNSLKDEVYRQRQWTGAGPHVEFAYSPAIWLQ